jgi:hypothetical protein
MAIRGSDLGEAQAWLIGELRRYGGSIRVRTLQGFVAGSPYTWRTITAAREALPNVEVCKVSTPVES